jgi:hypothetical protein
MEPGIYVGQSDSKKNDGLLPFQMFASFYLGVAEKEMKVFYSLNSR